MSALNDIGHHEPEVAARIRQLCPDAAKAVKIPEGVATDVAVAVLLQGMTAHYLAHDSHAIQPGDRVLVHAAAGGVGQLLTQFAKLRGGFVIATASSDEKRALARELGADEVMSYAPRQAISWK